MEERKFKVLKLDFVLIFQYDKKGSQINECLRSLFFLKNLLTLAKTQTIIYFPIIWYYFSTIMTKGSNPIDAF
jgi:hypothetical protein